MQPDANIHSSPIPGYRQARIDRRTYRPSFPLSRFVELLWSSKGAATPTPRHRVYPRGAMALVVHLKRPTLSFFMDGKAHSVRSPLLAGPYSRSFDIDPSESTDLIGALFRPGAAQVFFPVSASELLNVDIALRDLNPAEADRLVNNVCSAVGEAAQLQALEGFLTRMMRDSCAVHPAVEHAVAQLSSDGGATPISRIRKEVCLSHTRLIHLFRKHVGLTPKAFGRVRRFSALMQRLEKGAPLDWAGLAIDCGYFDQAHLIREFRAFSGSTPFRYVRGLSD